jgi:hypothetical protein
MLEKPHVRKMVKIKYEIKGENCGMTHPKITW